MRVRRFFYVISPGGRVKHIQYGTAHSEGRTACGRNSHPGWMWAIVSRLKRCKACEKAA